MDLKMKKISKKYWMSLGVLVVISLGLLAFANNFVDPIDYLQSANSDNSPLVKSHVFDDVKIEVNYRPAAYMATSQLVKSQIKDGDYEEIKSEFASTSNYNLKIENLGGGAIMKGIANDAMQYQDLVQYLSFGIQQDLYIGNEQDTFPCSFVHFERNYDVAPFLNVQFGFNLDNFDKGEEWFVMFDADRFRLGPLYYRFENNEKFENPSLEF